MSINRATRQHYRRHVRSLVGLLKRERPRPKLGMEIGCFSGEMADALLRYLPSLNLVLCDPYSPVPEGCPYHDKAQSELWGQPEWDEIFVKARQRLRKYAGRVLWRLCTDTEMDWIDGIDGKLDFVFLDALHDESSVRRGLEVCYPRLRSGGIFAGHDYHARFEAIGDPGWGVKKAVDAFVSLQGLPPVEVLHGRVFWLRKP